MDLSTQLSTRQVQDLLAKAKHKHSVKKKKSKHGNHAKTARRQTSLRKHKESQEHPSSIIVPPKKAKSSLLHVPTEATCSSSTKSPIPDSGDKCFQWLIHPISPDQFLKNVWEKKPLLIKRNFPEYYKGLFSTEEMDDILQNNIVEFGKHLDVTSYQNGIRETHNPNGRAFPAVVWDYFQKGCSIRMLSPQTHSSLLWKINSMLQNFFGSFVGANVYLTPKGTQGFAPHYDDIEAFILQVEGKKKWNVYPPKSISEELPRISSPNFSQNEIGKPILQVELNPGDLLYFPRGFIHQAKSSDDIHSLHITLSTYQKNSWADLFEKLMPQALNNAIQEDVSFRQSLPIGYLNIMGVANNDMQNEERSSFLLKVSQLFGKLLHHLPVDAAVDQMGKQLMHQSLPPKLTDEQKMCSIHGNGERWKKGRITLMEEINLKTEVRLLNPSTIRLVMEEEEVRLYHSLENTRVYEEVEPQYIPLGADQAPCIEYFLYYWPEYINVESLPGDNKHEKLDLANLLYDKGLMVTKIPLKQID